MDTEELRALLTEGITHLAKPRYLDLPPLIRDDAIASQDRQRP